MGSEMCIRDRNNGVEFSGDPLDDYDILIDCIAEDLASVEVA